MGCCLSSPEAPPAAEAKSELEKISDMSAEDAYPE